MLKYLVTVTEDLLSAAILTGLLFAYAGLVDGSRGRRAIAAGSGAGIAAAAVMAYMKNATNRIDTGTWNLRIFALSLLALAVCCLLSLTPLRRLRPAGGILRIGGAALAFTYLFYALPNDLAYPFNFSLSGETVFSTAFLYRLIGWLGGVTLVVLAGLAAERSARRMGRAAVGRVLMAVAAVNAVQQVAKALQTLLARRIIPSNRSLFQFARFTSNHSDWFIFAVMLLSLIIPAALWLRSFRVNEPYENPAQHRKIRAAWRNTRRWASLMGACFLLSLLNLTAVAAYNNRPVEIAPAEPCEVRGDNVYVSLSQVEDGHLHRFVYTTPNNIDVRLIVIKKPNASSYGVGLDACDICGETGYYERNGQIVCKLCDVVMNVNTIGFKGGCNPIVVDYRVEGGYIIVPTAGLIANEQEFK